MELLEASKCITKFLGFNITRNEIHPTQRVQNNLDPKKTIDLHELVLTDLLHPENGVDRAFVIQNVKNDRIIPKNYYSKTAKYILFVSDSQNVETNIQAWKSQPTWNPLAPIFVVLHEYSTQREVAETVEKVFNILHKHDVWKCFVIVPTLQDGFVDLLSWFPYEEKMCSKSSEKYETLDRCFFGLNVMRSGRKLTSKVDEWRAMWSLNNLNQCPIRVSASIGAVLAVANNGTSPNLTFEISKNPHVRTAYNEKLQIRKFQKVLLEDSDILIGGIAQRLMSPNLFRSTQTVHYSDYVTWCVKVLTKEGDWRNLFFTFSKPLWVAIIAFTILLSLPIYYYLRADIVRSVFILSMMYSIQISMGQSSKYLPKKIMGRVLLALILFYGLIMGSLFQSGNVKSMTNYYHRKQITSIHEAIDGTYEFIGTKNTQIVLS